MPGANCTLLITCPDRPGLVAAVAGFLVDRGANIVHADQHVDRQENLFLQRIEFTVPHLDSSGLREDFDRFSQDFNMTWTLRTPDRPRRVAILTSKESHCLADLLSRWDIGEMAPAELVFVASNHPDHAGLVSHHDVGFHHIPVDPDNPKAHHLRVREFCDDNRVDLLILARYMQIVDESMVDAYRNRIINIHHSFLPAFGGARPYHQAQARGVKLIGATAHYVTSELDEGPIIAQDVLRVSHRDGVEELRQKGRDLEKVVLARAVRLHLNDRILPYGNRTAVFD
ncbi:MAG TPA: formyltetrahydrofolate deformylase [Acidimicrobiia bacterium]|nr:formyltetrahydrofolate deformylase [Acidimicrobiia bacterium]